MYNEPTIQFAQGPYFETAGQRLYTERDFIPTGTLKPAVCNAGLVEKVDQIERNNFQSSSL